MGQISTKIAIFDSFVKYSDSLSVPNHNWSTLWTRTGLCLSFSMIFHGRTYWWGLYRGEKRVKFHPILPFLANFHANIDLSYTQITIDWRNWMNVNVIWYFKQFYSWKLSTPSSESHYVKVFSPEIVRNMAFSNILPFQSILIGVKTCLTDFVSKV